MIIGGVSWENGVALLSGRHVLLRDFSPEDWITVRAYAADPEVVRYMSWGPNSPEQSMGFVAGAVITAQERPRTRFDLAVVDQSTNFLIGGAGLYIRSGREFEAEIGYCLRREVWGHGYGTEVARLLVNFGFTKLALHRIMATCDPKNVASARVLENAGLQREGLMRGHMLVHTGWRDSFLYAVLVTDSWYGKEAEVH
jgi:RimJ/RimL family protein N-acetyltransferase